MHSFFCNFLTDYRSRLVGIISQLGLLLACWVTCAGATETATPLPVHNQRMGICTHFAQKDPSRAHWSPEVFLPRVAELGVGWIRDEILWSEVEVKPGEYQIPEMTQKWVDMANAMGIKVIACFGGSRPFYADSIDPDAYAKAAAFVAKELEGKIAAIEILNEPFDSFAARYKKSDKWYGLENDGTVTPWIRKYVVLLNKAAETIRAVNPEIKIIGLGSTTPVNFRQLEMVISPKVDGITEHPYSFRVPPELVPYRGTESFINDIGFAVTDPDGTFESYVERLRQKSAQHNGPKEIWFTEWGYSTFREGSTKKSFMFSGFSEEAQAKYALRRYMQSLAMGVEVSCMYELVDDGEDEFNAEHRFGLIRKDRTLKPAFAAVRRLAAATEHLKRSDAIKMKVTPFSDRTEAYPVQWDGITLPALNRIYCYQFENENHETILALWSAERAGDLSPRCANIELDVDPVRYQVNLTDLLTGQSYIPKSQTKDGHLLLNQVAIPDHPVLIQLTRK